MKVLLDTAPLQNASSGRGIGAYTRELLSSLRELASIEHPLVLQATHELSQPVIEPENEFDLIHYPYFDLFFETLPKTHKLPFIVTIHDVIPLLYPRQYPKGVKGSIRLWRQKKRVQQAALIITDSEASKKGIQTKLGIPAQKIRVIPLAGNSQIKELSESQARRYAEKLDLPGKYIVYVGDINYNKNLPVLLLALTQLPDDLHLCVISRTFNNTDIPEGQQLAKIIKDNNLSSRVHLLDIPAGNPSAFSAVLRQSEALVQPSLWEGFGLPVLEAMQAGAVVVSSNAGSLPEVVGDAGILVEPTLIGLVSGIEEAVKLRGEKRQALLEAGRQQTKKFSWQMTAQRTYQVYLEVLESL